MNKATIIDMFKKNDGTNFIIYTSIGAGRGINGVSFKTFIGTEYDCETSKCLVQKSKIVGFNDDCLILEVENHSADCGRGRIGTMKVCLPYSSIVMVEFVEKTNTELYFPKKLPFKHNFNDFCK